MGRVLGCPRKLGSKGRISWFLHKFGESISVIHVLSIYVTAQSFCWRIYRYDSWYDPNKCSPNDTSMKRFSLRSPTNIYEQDHDPGW